MSTAEKLRSLNGCNHRFTPYGKARIEIGPLCVEAANELDALRDENARLKEALVMSNRSADACRLDASRNGERADAAESKLSALTAEAASQGARELEEIVSYLHQRYPTDPAAMIALLEKQQVEWWEIMYVKNRKRGGYRCDMSNDKGEYFRGYGDTFCKAACLALVAAHGGTET